jgi:hypothetical protein
MGMSMEYTAIEDARKKQDQFFCKCKTDDGIEFEIMATEGFEHYGPRLALIRE